MEKIYIETSIVSYLTARPSNNLIAAAWQKETFDWRATQRHQFALYISDIVLEEAAMGESTAASRRLEVLADIPVLALNESVVKLSKVLIDATLQELWTIKDGIAKEHAYDLDKLVHYLKEKYQPNVETELSHVSPSKESESARRLRLKTPENAAKPNE